jgi:hypothetical protein
MTKGTFDVSHPASPFNQAQLMRLLVIELKSTFFQDSKYYTQSSTLKMALIDHVSDTTEDNGGFNKYVTATTTYYWENYNI